MVSTLDFESSDPGSNPALWTLNPAIRVQIPVGARFSLWTLNPAIRVQRYGVVVSDQGRVRELNDWMSVDDFVDGAMDCWSGCSYGVMVSTLDFESSDPGSNPALWTLNPAIRVQIALWTLNPAIRVQFPRELNDWMSVDDFVDGRWIVGLVALMV
ncbi:unnamed protein product [Peronospora belbahrii]|uniref:Uncharacterized protein n=1 Tax=Peronospora belbahrii TaxID=622444 RepID=A0AAU9LAP7_9STRA|nr:unnamed protein product [Peronospora belbahrii]